MEDVFVNLKIKDEHGNTTKTQVLLSELNLSKNANVFILNKQKYKEKIVSIEIPNFISQLGPFAFQYCSNLEEIKLPQNLKSIESSAFDWCNNLKEIKLPQGLETIQRSAFNCCLALTKVNIPPRVTYIEENAFFSCENIENFTVSKNNTVYATVKGMITSKDKTKLLIIPPKKLYDTFTIPKGITKLGDFLFAGSYDIVKTVIIPEGVTDICAGCFANTSIEHITLPKSLTTIGCLAFVSCKKIKAITLNENITNFGALIFKEWGKAQTIFVKTKKSADLLKLKEILEEKNTATLVFKKC